MQNVGQTWSVAIQSLGMKINAWINSSSPGSFPVSYFALSPSPRLKSVVKSLVNFASQFCEATTNPSFSKSSSLNKVFEAVEGERVFLKDRIPLANSRLQNYWLWFSGTTALLCDQGTAERLTSSISDPSFSSFSSKWRGRTWPSLQHSETTWTSTFFQAFFDWYFRSYSLSLSFSLSPSVVATTLVVVPLITFLWSWCAWFNLFSSLPSFHCKRTGTGSRTILTSWTSPLLITIKKGNRY